jgi:hypothetical protein
VAEIEYMTSASCVTNLVFIIYIVCFIQCVENCRQTCSDYSDYLLNYRNFIALEVFSGSKEFGW